MTVRIPKTYDLIFVAAFSKRLYIGVRKYLYHGKLNMQLRKQKNVSWMAVDSSPASRVGSPVSESAPSRSLKQTTPMAEMEWHFFRESDVYGRPTVDKLL